MGTFEELVDQLAEALDEAAEGIREALRSKGRPQKYLANRVTDASPSLVSRWLSGARQLTERNRLPGAGTMRQIAEVLELPREQKQDLIARGTRIDMLRRRLEAEERGWRTRAAELRSQPGQPGQAGSPGSEPGQAAGATPLVSPSQSGPPGEVGWSESGSGAEARGEPRPSPGPEARGELGPSVEAGAPGEPGPSLTAGAVGEPGPSVGTGAAAESSTSAAAGATGESGPGLMAGARGESGPSARAEGAWGPSLSTGARGEPGPSLVMGAAGEPGLSPEPGAKGEPGPGPEAGAAGDAGASAGVGAAVESGPRPVMGARPGPGSGPQAAPVARRTVPLLTAAVAAVAVALISFLGGVLAGRSWSAQPPSGDAAAAPSASAPAQGERCSEWTDAGDGVRLEACVRVRQSRMLIRTRMQAPAGTQVDLVVQAYDTFLERPVTKELKCHRMTIKAEGEIQTCGWLEVRPPYGSEYATRAGWRVPGEGPFGGYVVSPGLPW